MKIGEKIFKIIFVAPGMIIILSSLLTLIGVPKEITFNISISLTFILLFYSDKKEIKKQ